MDLVRGGERTYRYFLETKRFFAEYRRFRKERGFTDRPVVVNSVIERVFGVPPGRTIEQLYAILTRDDRKVSFLWEGEYKRGVQEGRLALPFDLFAFCYGVWDGGVVIDARLLEDVFTDRVAMESLSKENLRVTFSALRNGDCSEKSFSELRAVKERGRRDICPLSGKMPV